ncbi:LptA/OstA family protein [Myxococcaceae bacterium GXIMD 01537]
MIDFLMMALFVAQPQPAAAGAPAGGTRPPMVGQTPLRDPVKISAKLVTGDRAQSVFTGDVLVTHRTMELRCDKMTAYYTQAQEVTRVECAGNVRAVDGDRTARGERADYDVPAGVLVVTGSPEARQGTTYMTGTRVRLTLGKDRVEVENAKIIVETAPQNLIKQRKPGAAAPAGGGKQP